MYGIVYARDADDNTVTFAVSGFIWENNLVMIDEETESLWSHLLGESMKGPMKGAHLEVLPSLMTDWESWKEAYPETSVALMSRTADYNRTNPRMRDQLTVAIKLDGEQRFWPVVFLVENVVNDVVADHPIVVAYHEPKLTAAIYDRRVADRELTFFLDYASATFRDHETRTVWDLCTGKAISGPLQEEQLTRLPSVVAEGLAYSTFHPKSVRGRPAGPKVEPKPLEEPAAEDASGQ